MFDKLDKGTFQNILNNLPLQDVIKNELVSHQWRNQWKYLQNIVFNSSWTESMGQEIVPSVTRFISLHQGTRIKKFHVDFQFESSNDDDVNKWISFVVEKKVEDLHINFDIGDKHMGSPFYILPPTIFTCKSLIFLWLKCCKTSLLDSVDLPILRTLTLRSIEIQDEELRKLTSSTQLLEQLSLFDCSRTIYFKIETSANSNLKQLDIIETSVHFSTKPMEINAPSVEKLHFLFFAPRSKYHVKDLTNCLECTFDEPQDQPQATSWQNTFLPLRYHLVLLQILPSFAHVRVIRMGNLCVQGLYKALVRMRMVSLSCTRLEINASFQKWELPGIVVLLRACPVVEDLRFVMTPKHKKIQQFLGEPFDFEPIQIWKNEVNSLVATHLRNLKVVRIKLPGGRNRSRNLEDVFAKDEFGSELIRGLWNHGKHVRVLFSNVKVKSE